MLLLLLGAHGAPRQPGGILGPQDMDILRSLARRSVCVSQAVELKSGTCNQLCTEASQLCPKACSCVATTDTYTDLTKGIPSKEYKQLGMRWFSKHPTPKLHKSRPQKRIKLSRRTIPPVSLPEEQLEGFCESPPHPRAPSPLSVAVRRSVLVRLHRCEDVGMQSRF